MNHAPLTCCPAEYHDSLKRNLLTFRDQTRYHADQDDGAGGTLELRHCGRCSTTLAIDQDVLAMAECIKLARSSMRCGDHATAGDWLRRGVELAARIDRHREYVRQLDERAAAGMVVPR